MIRFCIVILFQVVYLQCSVVLLIPQYTCWSTTKFCSAFFHLTRVLLHRRPTGIICGSTTIALFDWLTIQLHFKPYRKQLYYIATQLELMQLHFYASSHRDFARQGRITKLRHLKSTNYYTNRKCRNTF